MADQKAEDKEDDPESLSSQSKPSTSRRNFGEIRAEVSEATRRRLRESFKGIGSSVIVDSMTYESKSLLGWSVFTIWGNHSAFANPRIYSVAIYLLGISALTALPVVFLIPDAAEVKASKLKDIITFLRYFVGLLLGFFLSSSVNRWYECVGGFLELFDAIRNLQMQFYALGVSKEKTYTCIRYGVLSGWFLSMELRLEKLPTEKKLEGMTKMWNDVLDQGKINSERGQYLLLSPDECAVLRSVENPECELSVSTSLWMWVGSLVGRMAQDGEIPPMQSPTYGRIMNIAQDAHSGIRKVRAAVSVQVPFVYAHTLAILVHINNFFSAVSFGITLGLTVGSWWMLTRGHHPNPKGKDFKVNMGDVYRDVETLFVNFITGMLGPFIYQMLLDVSMCIAQPFHNEEANIPTEKLLACLEKDLQDAKLMAERPALWESPFFQDPAKK